jgi:hypothetical protein
MEIAIRLEHEAYLIQLYTGKSVDIVMGTYTMKELFQVSAFLCFNPF